MRKEVTVVWVLVVLVVFVFGVGSVFAGAQVLSNSMDQQGSSPGVGSAAAEQNPGATKGGRVPTHSGAPQAPTCECPPSSTGSVSPRLPASGSGGSSTSGKVTETPKTSSSGATESNAQRPGQAMPENMETIPGARRMTATPGAQSDVPPCACPPSPTETGPPISPANAGGTSGAATGRTESSGVATEQMGSMATPLQGDENSAAGGVNGQSAQENSTATTPIKPISENEELAGLIQNALRNEPRLTSNDLRVEVNDSRIILSGSVPTGKQKQAAERVAKSFAINRQVVNHLTVSGK